MQRLPDRTWVPRTPVVRSSKKDPIVNVSRGAKTVVATQFLPEATISNIQQESLKIVHRLSSLPQGNWLLELGLDFVIDSEWRPWFIEVNAQPKGRLQSLAKKYPKRFQVEYQQCLRQPIETISGWLTKK